MADNNPYHIPTIYEAEAELAGYRRTVQNAEKEKIVLDELKRQQAEAEQARQVKRDEYGKIDQEATRVPAGFNLPPAVKPTVPGGFEAPAEVPTSPFGTSQVAGYDTMGGMQEPSQQLEMPTAAPTEQPQQVTPVQQWKESQSGYNMISRKIAENDRIAKALRAKGLVDEADQYDNKNIELQSKADAAKEKFLTQTVKTLDLAGSLANATKNAMQKDPANADAYWNQFVMQAKMYGADEANQLAQVPPEQRAVMLDKVIDQSEDGKERSRMAIETMRTKARADRDAALNEIRQKRIDSQNRNAAASREIQKERLAFQEGKFEFTTLDNHIKDQIKDAETRKTSIDKDLSNLQKSLLDLQKGNMFYTASGRPMSSDDPEVLANEAASLQEAIKAKEDEKKDLDNFVNDLNTERNTLTKNIPKKKIDTSKEFKHGVKYKFVSGASADDIKVYQEQMAAAKTEADKLRIQQKAFEYGLVEPK